MIGHRSIYPIACSVAPAMCVANCTGLQSDKRCTNMRINGIGLVWDDPGFVNAIPEDSRAYNELSDNLCFYIVTCAFQSS